MCTQCSTLLGTEQTMTRFYDKKKCRVCDNEFVQEIEIPYIMKYLLIELISCNVNVKLDFIRKCSLAKCKK